MRPRRSDGRRTYEQIVNAAADLVSCEGLDCLTIGSLADRLAISKSGLFAHFGSKEQLQLATVEAARRRYVAVVLEPALKVARGWPRLEALCANTLAYVGKPEFPGGCFFVAAQAGARGAVEPVRNAVLDNKASFRLLLEGTIKAARAAGDVRVDVDPQQMAYELVCALDGASWSVVTGQRLADLHLARAAVDGILRRARAMPVKHP
jgi:AcrR family transcriptional regulator